MSLTNYPNIPDPTHKTMTEAQQRAYDQAQVMLAFSQGKKIQYAGIKFDDNSLIEWKDYPENTSPTWNWDRFDYRIAPEPQEVWLWVKEGMNPLLRWENTCITDLKERGYTKKLFREVL